MSYVMNTFVTLLYYVMAAYVAAMLLWNFARTRRWEQEVLYLLVAIPFLLRLLHLK